MARIPRRFSAAVSQVQDKLGGFSERFLKETAVGC